MQVFLITIKLNKNNCKQNTDNFHGRKIYRIKKITSLIAWGKKWTVVEYFLQYFEKKNDTCYCKHMVQLFIFKILMRSFEKPIVKN